jgi:hypothetical protein
MNFSLFVGHDSTAYLKKQGHRNFFCFIHLMRSLP